MFMKQFICALLVAQAANWGVPNAAFGRVLIAQDTTASRMVDSGIQLYMEGRYKKARQMLERALARQSLETNRRLGAMQYLASCHIALGELETAEKVFERLLDIKHDYQLPSGTAPKIVSVFERVRKEVESRRPPRPSIRHSPRKKAVLGTSLHLKATVENLPAGGSLAVLYRYTDTSKWNVKQMKLGTGGTWSTTLPSPMNVEKGELAYFIETRDPAEKPLSRSARPSSPHRVAFNPHGDSDSDSGSTWWIWVLVGGVVAGVAVGLGVGLSGGGTEKGRAIVTIEVID